MKSILASFIAFLISMAVAYAISANDTSSLSFQSPTVILFLITFMIQWIAFIPSAIYKTEKFYDLTGGISYLIIVWIAWSWIQPAPSLNTILALCVSIWAIRLSGFLFTRIRKAGVDTRFSEIKRSAPRFFLAWTMQGTWITIVSAPVLVVLASNEVYTVSYTSIFGLLVWLFGLIYEIVADQQKTKFKANPANHGQFISTGLWSTSRHPNYFGEWLVWVGIWFTTLPALSGYQYISLISPVFVYFLLTRVSGIPLLEQQGQERWGSDPNYQTYMASVPKFIPSWLKIDLFSQKKIQ